MSRDPFREPLRALAALLLDESKGISRYLSSPAPAEEIFASGVRARIEDAIASIPQAKVDWRARLFHGGKSR